MGEHLLCKQGVDGSNPFASTKAEGRQCSEIGNQSDGFGSDCWNPEWIGEDSDPGNGSSGLARDASGGFGCLKSEEGKCATGAG